jgi:sialate O-acetylesterase
MSNQLNLRFKIMRVRIILFVLFLAFVGCQSHSNLKLPSLISDNMLLQQKTTAKIWGKANPGQKISVATSWNALGKAISGEDGKWSVDIATPGAGGPYTITIAANDTTITVKNVLIGEVWFCSGQSNMEMPMAGWPPVDTVMHSSETISSAAIPEIRLFNVGRQISGEPSDECTGSWEVSSSATVQQFSATACFFGRKLFNELHVPIGLIESAWGGTPSESWTSAGSLKKTNEFVSELNAIKESAPLQKEYHKWLKAHIQVEPGRAGANQWKSLVFDDDSIPAQDYNDSNWPVMTLPVLFETVIGDFDGAVWFRKKIDIPENMQGKDLILSLGPVDDMDRTYFNGTLIGSTEISGFWQLDRIYPVPSKLVKKEGNVISVRVIDTQGGGGIYGTPDKMKIYPKNDTSVSVSLKGDWTYQPVAELLDGKFYVYDFSKNEFQTHKRPVNLGPGTPSVLFNGMVSPVLPYKIKGAIWYQGEANVGRAEQYAKIFPAMIEDWRAEWGIKDFPFYFVQIAPFEYSGVDSTESGFLREAQAKALTLPATGMVVTLDIATVKNIHPPFKKEVGERLALLALDNDYGMKYPAMGPVYESISVEGGVAKLKFENVGAGLVAKDGKLKEFEIAGSNGRYVKADAKISNNEVLVSSHSVKEPVSVRYCWRNGAEASLFNKDGLPAWQFRTK